MTVLLSDRLQAVADMVAEGARVVDVGTDHALLPIYLYQIGRVVSAVATDIAYLPAQAAQENLREYGLEKLIDVRVGSGLKTVSPGEVDTVAIAGMGGATIRDVLVDVPEVLAQVHRVVVQPMNLGHHVRQFFLDHGWALFRERVVDDRGRTYEVFAADRSTLARAAQDYSERLEDPVALSVAMLFGPTLLRDPTPPFVRLVRATVAQWDRQLQMMQQSRRPGVTEQARRLQRQIKWVETWIAGQSEKEAAKPSC